MAGSIVSDFTIIRDGTIQITAVEGDNSEYCCTARNTEGSSIPQCVTLDVMSKLSYMAIGIVMRLFSL